MAGNPIELKFITHKTLSGLEWSGKAGAPPIVVLSGDDLERWDKVGSDLAGQYRVVAVNPGLAYDLVNVAWGMGEPAVVIAQGNAACTLAARAAIVGTGAVRSLVLIEFGGVGSAEWLRELKAPTLVLRGRQSESQSHKDAVVLHELIRNSHLIEPEDCGGNLIETAPGIVAEAIGWYLGNFGHPPMDYPVNGDPVDPKAG